MPSSALLPALLTVFMLPSRPNEGFFVCALFATACSRRMAADGIVLQCLPQKLGFREPAKAQSLWSD